jgi:murein DD-endopeptidase MepM/ murein hydrolase activator NlpD
MCVKISSQRTRIITMVAIIFIAFWGLGGISQADTLDDLRKAIEEKNSEIEKLEEEIQKYRVEVEEKQKIGQTLKSEIVRINANISKLKSEIALAESKIRRTELEIEETGFEIRDKEISLRKLQGGLAGILQAFFEKDREPLFFTLLKFRALSDFFKQIDQVSMLQNRLLESLKTIKKLKNELEIKKAGAEEKRTELEDLRKLLRSRHNVLNFEQNNQNYLLRVTQNEEKRYQTLLDEQETKREALEKEIREIEEKIRITIDPSSLPSKGRGVLGYPLPDVELTSCWKNGASGKNCLTQAFGNTDFAAGGAYAGKGHNGVDFRASIGTPVFSAGSGIVKDTGDTDLGCRRASYGKWILIEHDNGLSTLYAHLANIEVAKGQAVSREMRIGLSGNTGYATGPHLHFTVFASKAVEVTQIRSRVCGRLMTLPIAAINGYLNPLDYL